MRKKISISIEENTYVKIVEEARKLDMSLSSYLNSILGNKKQIKNAQLEEYYEFKSQISTALNKRKYMLKIENEVEATEVEKQIIRKVEETCQL